MLRKRGLAAHIEHPLNLARPARPLARLNLNAGLGVRPQGEAWSAYRASRIQQFVTLAALTTGAATVPSSAFAVSPHRNAVIEPACRIRARLCHKYKLSNYLFLFLFPQPHSERDRVSGGLHRDIPGVLQPLPWCASRPTFHPSMTPAAGTDSRLRGAHEQNKGPTRKAPSWKLMP